MSSQSDPKASSSKPSQPAKRQAPDVARAIFTEARGARQNAEQLLPLLGLLQEGSEDGGPLAQLTEMLEAIMLSQRHLIAAVEDLDRKVDALSGRARRLPSQASPDSAATQN